MWQLLGRIGRLGSAGCVGRASYGVVRTPHLLTTPIFYVNAAPHLGHVYSAVLADVQYRYSALCGQDARLSTGTDEHGIKVQQAATAFGLDPSNFCTSISQQFRTMFDTMAISYTDFVRTTEYRHAQAVCHFWKILEDKGYIYKGTYQGWYCTSDEAFLSEDQTVESRDAEGNKIRVSIESGHQVLEKDGCQFKKGPQRVQIKNIMPTLPDL